MPLQYGGIRPPVVPIGPVHVRLTGVVRSDSKGQEQASISAPNVAEATAALHRIARVNGADDVIGVASDYRRAALAAGPLSTQWRVEVMAWGTAVIAAAEGGDDS